MASEALDLDPVDDSSGEQVLIAAAQRDRRRFGELYEEHFERVYAFVLRRVRHREEAEDATSETFQRALAALDSFEWRGIPFSAWLFRIAANVIHDRRTPATASTEEVSPVAADPGPEEIEERTRLFRMVNDLPADQRTVLLLRFAAQRSIREIAAGLQRTEGAVKQLQFRALNNLRARLDDRNVGK
jgi:RNA polymerase sigma-70 factor (ECF subfamily)